MAASLDFAYVLDNGEAAAMFVGHFLDPIFGPPNAIDSRKVDGRWVHLLWDANMDLHGQRARLALAAQQAAEAETAAYYAFFGEDGAES